MVEENSKTKKNKKWWNEIEKRIWNFFLVFKCLENSFRFTSFLFLFPFFPLYLSSFFYFFYHRCILFNLFSLCLFCFSNLDFGHSVRKLIGGASTSHPSKSAIGSSSSSSGGSKLSSYFQRSSSATSSGFRRSSSSPSTSAFAVQQQKPPPSSSQSTSVLPSDFCPSCLMPFDNNRKRRLIDSCGHERCYACLFSNELCPLCSPPPPPPGTVTKKTFTFYES